MMSSGSKGIGGLPGVWKATKTRKKKVDLRQLWLSWISLKSSRSDLSMSLEMKKSDHVFLPFWKSI